MKVYYDKEVDSIYLELTKLKPEGVIEVTEGINIDVTSDGRIVGIELLDATQKVSFDSLLTYEIEAESIGEWYQASKCNGVVKFKQNHEIRVTLSSIVFGSRNFSMSSHILFLWSRFKSVKAPRASAKRFFRALG